MNSVSMYLTWNKSLIEDLRTARATDVLLMSQLQLTKCFRYLENIPVMSDSQKLTGDNKTPAI